MIKHVVMWRLYDEAEGRSKADNIRIFLEKLETLPNRIPQIQSFDFGANAIDQKEQADVVLIAEFKDKQALEAYRTHPAHLEFIKNIKNFRYERRVVDIEY